MVRYWGGDPRLVSALQHRGVQVATIGEAAGFADVRRNVRAIARDLGQAAAGEALIARMDGQLARANGAWGGATALYLTPSGVTAGPGTLVDAVLSAAGMRNAESRPGYRQVSLESLALAPPKTVVLGFFDTFMLSGDSWGPGRHQVLRDLVRRRAVASLPGSTLGCPDWFAAEAAELLARRAP